MLVGDQQKPTKLQGLICPGNAAPGTKVECPGADTIVADNMELKVFLTYTIYNDIHNTQWHTQYAMTYTIHDDIHNLFLTDTIHNDTQNTQWHTQYTMQWHTQYTMTYTIHNTQWHTRYTMIYTIHNDIHNLSLTYKIHNDIHHDTVVAENMDFTLMNARDMKLQVCIHVLVCIRICGLCLVYLSDNNHLWYHIPIRK